VQFNWLFIFYFCSAGHYPRNSPVKFRGDSGLKDGDSANNDLTGGFYDSGNNIKFTFTTAYTMTLLSWTVMEYQSKYADIGELDHVRDIIRWGSDYLLKVFTPPNSADGSNLMLYSQASYNFFCWERILGYHSNSELNTNRYEEKLILFFHCFIQFH